jgi:hypothetical protein
VPVDQMVSPIQGLIAYHAKVQVLDHVRRPSNGDRIRPYASTHGISVKAHHADNRIFKANKWVESSKKAGQGLTFAGVNSHHENGIAERQIKEILDVARTMLIHANRRWKHSGCKAGVRAVAHSDVHMNLKHWHPFGTPVYVLDSDLQTHGEYSANEKAGPSWELTRANRRNTAGLSRWS